MHPVKTVKALVVRDADGTTDSVLAVLDRAKKAGWRLDHHGSLGEVENADDVDGVRVGGSATTIWRPSNRRR